MRAETPSAEVCNGFDDDRDGMVDEGFGLGEACTGANGCAGVTVCGSEGGVTCGCRGTAQNHRRRAVSRPRLPR